MKDALRQRQFEDDIDVLTLILPLRALSTVLSDLPENHPPVSFRRVKSALDQKHQDMTQIVRTAVQKIFQALPSSSIFETCVERFDGMKNPFYESVKEIVKELIG